LARVIKFLITPGIQNFIAIGLGVSVPQIRDFDVTIFFFLGGSPVRLQPTPLNGFLRKIRQMTSFRVRNCLLRFPMT